MLQGLIFERIQEPTPEIQNSKLAKLEEWKR